MKLFGFWSYVILWVVNINPSAMDQKWLVTKFEKGSIRRIPLSKSLLMADIPISQIIDFDF